MTTHPSTNVIVIGGSGFIGTVLVRRLLEQNHRVRIYDKRRSTAFPDLCTIGDVRDVDATVAACADQEVIYNLAAEHHDNVRPKSLYTDVNVGGAESIVTAAEAHNIRQIIFTSSVAVYPLSSEAANEDTIPAPFNEYGRTKFLAEQVFRRWQAETSGCLVMVRPTAVFGEANRGNVYNLAREIARRRFVLIGDGRNRKSLAYVSNLVESLVHVMTLESGTHVFNYADKPDYDMNSLVSDIRSALDLPDGARIRVPYPIGLSVGYLCDALGFATTRNLPVSSIRIRKFCANTQFSSDRIRRLGVAQQVDIRQGLKNTIRAQFGHH